jgi:hypothetical protein
MRITVLVAALAVVSAADAQTVAKEGRYDYTACFSGVSNAIAFSKTHMAYTRESIGTNRSNTLGGLHDKETFRCLSLVMEFDGTNRTFSVCDTIDRDGHRRLTSFAPGPDGNPVRRMVAGTGKWDGMVVSNTKVEPLGPFPEIKPGMVQNCVRQLGDYKLK